MLYDPVPKRRKVNISWTWRMLDDSTTFLPVNINSQQNAKILAALPPDPTPLDFVKLYIMEPLVDLIVTETNRYAAQFIASNTIPPHSPVHQRQPTDRNELYAFLGLTVLPGRVTRISELFQNVSYGISHALLGIVRCSIRAFNGFTKNNLRLSPVHANCSHTVSLLCNNYSNTSPTLDHVHCYAITTAVLHLCGITFTVMQ